MEFRRARGGMGIAIVAASVLYLMTDIVEAVQGGFSPVQLWLTLGAEAAIPVIVVGLALVASPRFGLLGWVSAWAYAYSYVFFVGTVIYALARGVPDYATLSNALEPWMLIHGALMVAAGVGFGAAVLRGGVTSRWPALSLMVGVVLVAALQGAPVVVQVVAAAVRDLGFAGMGMALMNPRGSRPLSVVATDPAGRR